MMVASPAQPPKRWRATGPQNRGFGQDLSLDANSPTTGYYSIPAPPAYPTNPFGNLFASWDISTWTWEWVVLGVAVYALGSFIFDVRGGITSIREFGERRRRRAKRKRELEGELEEL